MDITKELKKDGMLLKKIPKKEQTIDICKMAIRQNPLALQFVSRKCLDSKMCLAAVKKDGQAFRYVPSQFITRKMCELAVEADPELLNNVPENFRTLRICINAIKKDVSTLSYVSREKRYELFDNNTEIDLIKKVVEHNSKWLMYMPNRPDVRAFCISCMEEDFSVAQYMPEQIKIADDILNYQKTKGKLHFIHKYYNSEEGKFCVKIKVVCGQHASIFDENEMIEESYCVVMEFGDFDKFYSFLDGDLFDAELRNFDFKGIDLKQYNIDGATINSEILQLQGLYDGTYFSSIKKILETDSDEFMGSNEIMIPNEFCYPKPIDDDEHERFDISHIPFFYISDIHLAHRVCNKFKDKATKEEIRSYIKYLARSMVSSIGTRPYNSYLLIAGDTSSIFEFAAIFYNELIQWWNPNQIVVVPGNHELWDPCIDMEDNIEIYRKFFDDLGIIFLQNDLMCVEDRKKCEIFSEVEILKMSEEEIRSNLKKYVENVNQLLYRYVGGQQRISEFIKHLGGSGKIHGCIVDVERPNELEGFSYCHLFVNPIDGKVTPYFAYDVKSRIVYKDFKALLQAHDSCKLMANNYLRLEKESVHNLPTIQYSGQMEEWENEDSMYDEGGYLYKISRIIKSLQYCAEKNIVRLWNEELLNYDFVNRIKQSNKIDEIVDDRLMIDEKSI